MALDIGPYGWENWRAFEAQQPRNGAVEVTCYTDAHITGQIDQLGPYAILNPVARPRGVGLAVPGIVIRIDNHLVRNPTTNTGPDMTTTDYSRYYGGSTDDELAALLSLSLGIRLHSGGQTRVFWGDDEQGRPLLIQHQAPYLEPPQLERGSVLPGIDKTVLLEDATAVLAQYCRLTAAQAITLVRAAQSYQQALWVADNDANLAWIHLVGAIESAAGQWAQQQISYEEVIRLAHPKIAALLGQLDNDAVFAEVARLLAPLSRSRRKFLDFLLAHLPTPPSERPPEYYQLDWSPEGMKNPFSTIYTCRSQALHGGIPFPAPMCWPPMWHGDQSSSAPTEIPAPIAASSGGGVWLAKDAPMTLHIFAHIVRGALLSWWNAMAASNPGRFSDAGQ